MFLFFTYTEGENHLVMRKVGASISKTIYEDFKVAAEQLEVKHLFQFKDSLHQIVCTVNNARIDFTGLDDPEKIKGISNYKRIFLDEWSEYDEEDDKQIRKRLRGKHGQQIITAFNPISEMHWIKTNIFDKETWHDEPMKIKAFGQDIPVEYTEVKSLRINSAKQVYNPRTRQFEEHAPDTIAIQTTYLNNFWVVGSPCGTFGYYDRQCIADFEKDRINDPNYYNIYALGEWGRLQTGSEFFQSFNRGVHCIPAEYDPTLPVHISVDNNFLPYITTTLWQVDYTDGTQIRQIREVLATPPDNSARKAAKLVADKLKELDLQNAKRLDVNLQSPGYKVIMHGDASIRNRNTIDDEGRSFHDKYIEVLQTEGFEVEDKVGTANPNVAMTGEFINAIFEGEIEDVSILIGDNCKTSIDDYLAVQKDSNGSILKVREKNRTTGQSYEKQGHCSDTFRYLVCDILSKEYTLFSNRRKRNLYARDGVVRYYNPTNQYIYTERITYVMPDYNSRFVMISAARVGDKWHILDAECANNNSPAFMEKRINETTPDYLIVESHSQYFQWIRTLREIMPFDIKALLQQGDIDARISATFDFVRENILFNETKECESISYAIFMNNLLDYSREGSTKESSAVLSGFAKYALKSM